MYSYNYKYVKYEDENAYGLMKIKESVVGLREE